MTRLSFIADTHTMHGQLTQQIIFARPDVLVHCGDFTGAGRPDEVRSFAEWCGMLLCKGYTKHIVVIAGNHDVCFDVTHPSMKGRERVAEEAVAMLHDAGAHYLQDDSCELEGLLFYGSPWTPRFYDWAFQLDSEPQARKILDTYGLHEADVLVTHGPPYGIRDFAPRDNPHGGEHVGSDALRHALQHDEVPSIHAFGHIHEGYGITLGGDTLFINASTCTGSYKPTNPVISLEV